MRQSSMRPGFRLKRWWRVVLAVGLGLGMGRVMAGDGVVPRVTLVTYNVENYVMTSTGTRKAKSEASKAKVASVLRGLAPDVVGLQEVGGRAGLADLRARMAALGWAMEHHEWVSGPDTNIQVALLSRHPIVARRPHVRDSYLLSGRRFQVSRGFLEVEVQVRPDYRLTVFVAHLKSRRASPEADEREMRREEARLLREKVEARLRAAPGANVVVLGDLNDTHDAAPIRLLIGRGREGLVDTRPFERNGDTGYTANPRWRPRTVAWTHHYGVEDTYGRVDYILLSSGAAREWVAGASHVPVVADWGLASDHRPVVVVLEARDR